MTPGPADAATTAAQRMEALGRLAGGVAHDFNNVLMVISGYAEMLAQSVGDDEDSKEAVQTILEAAERATTLTRQLLLFSRRQSIEPADVALAPAVCALEKMLRRLVPEDVTLVIDAREENLVARVDPGQLDQVVFNLVANARDAMPTGGTLTIAVNGVYRHAFVDASGERALSGDYVLLTVSDTGAGMDESVRSRIFEPFFTTKSAGKGTGLGLATVYGIVKSSGGYVDVRSTVGAGTTFEVYLPLAGDATIADAPIEQAAGAGGHETILVAEDDGIVRALLQRTLTTAGYTVLSAVDGTEACTVARRHGGTIDLLLSDLVMPQMGGRELFAELRHSQPGIRAMFLTAHTDHAAIDAELADSSARLLRKPCRPRVLLQAIRESLDRVTACGGRS
jgi:two-component system cell cycle sensor histidine kinase/response regulator CckA